LDDREMKAYGGGIKRKREMGSGAAWDVDERCVGHAFAPNTEKFAPKEEHHAQTPWHRVRGRTVAEPLCLEAKTGRTGFCQRCLGHVRVLLVCIYVGGGGGGGGCL
jgi:hypothetical protein